MLFRSTHILMQQPMLYFSSSEATQHTHRFWITKVGNTQPPTHTLLKQPTLYISSSEATLHTTDVGLRRRETQSPTHSWCNNLCCTFLPARLLCTPADFELRMWETHSPTHILMQQPMLYFSSSKATQHAHRF